MRIDTLPTLNDWVDVVDTDVDTYSGWAADTEPGCPPARPQPCAVIELARRGVQCVPPEAALAELASAVSDTEGEPIVVAGTGGRPMGVVRTHDIVRALTDGPPSKSAIEVMTSSMFCLRLDAPVDRALELVAEDGAEEVLIIDDSGALVGLVLPQDLVRAVRRGPRAK